MATDDKAPRVPDRGTDRMDGDEIANAAADTLHGNKANEEMYPQPDATVLPAGGGTLIADEPPGVPNPEADEDVKARNLKR
jgi:hypothetical protein